MGDMGAFHACGKFGKIVPVRLRTGTDLTGGLLDAVIAEVADVTLARRLDPEVGMGLFTPEAGPGA